MNTFLRETIVKHILANFSIIPSTFVNQSRTKSLKSKEFLLPDTLSFIDLNDSTLKNKVWGCELVAGSQEIHIILADCSIEPDVKEYAILIQLKAQPIYGLYLLDHPDKNSEALIGVSLNGKEWLECNTYLQATFLAGMESLKDLGLAWNKSSNYKEQLSNLVSFISFHNDLYGDKDEG